MTNDLTVVEFSIDDSAANNRLDKFLGLQEQIGSRSRALHLIESEHVHVNGKLQKPSYALRLGDTVKVQLIEKKVESTLQPYELKLDIVFEDEHVIVVNKPAGLVVHPAAGHANDTLVNALLHHTDDLSASIDEERPGIVHRLDKDTSGLIVIAKTEAAMSSLSEQFKNKTTHRVYWAVAHGLLKNKTGRIETKLARHKTDRKKFSSTKGMGKVAATNYEVLHESKKEFSLVRLKLETGRTHQIRVHLSELGHPIVGDALYGANSRLRNVKSVEARKLILSMNRFALHAAELGFVHPVTKKDLNFKSGWPHDLLPLVESLGMK